MVPRNCYLSIDTTTIVNREKVDMFRLFFFTLFLNI